MASTRAYWYSSRRWSRATSTAAGATRSASERWPRAKRRSSAARGGVGGARRLKRSTGTGLLAFRRAAWSCHADAHGQGRVVVEALPEALAARPLGRPAGQEELRQL